jgi:hypothetical protein
MQYAIFRYGATSLRVSTRASGRMDGDQDEVGQHAAVGLFDVRLG